ncbi:MAG: glycolate oxidase subunit GlcE [Rhodospirillales bacterium]
MSETLRPETAEQAREAVAYALQEESPLEIRGEGSKRGFGAPCRTNQVLDTTGLSGITLYEPEELVLSARAGTPLRIIQAALDEKGQQFAFEPLDLPALYGGAPGSGTIGGLVATNLAGSRRIAQGAARDHVLGIHCVTGRGEAIKSGGRVVKNVTGYDLSKLMTGAHGTLALLTDVTLKVLPKAEECWTLMLEGLDAEGGVRALCDGLGSPHEVSGAAHLPADIADLAPVPAVAKAGTSATLLRLEGPLASVEARSAGLAAELGDRAQIIRLESDESRALWSFVSNARAFATKPETPLWKVSVKPTDGPKLIALLAAKGMPGRHFFDWGGGLVWFEAAADVEAASLRAIVANVGGHATLIRADAPTRARVPVFHPLSGATAALSKRIREAFDPKTILNPGRMGGG